MLIYNKPHLFLFEFLSDVSNFGYLIFEIPPQFSSTMGTFKSVKEINFKAVVKPEYFPSPLAWEDQVLYFLLIDRFSDGNENNFSDNEGNLVTDGTTAQFSSEDAGNATGTVAEENALG